MMERQLRFVGSGGSGRRGTMTADELLRKIAALAFSEDAERLLRAVDNPPQADALRAVRESIVSRLT